MEIANRILISSSLKIDVQPGLRMDGGGEGDRNAIWQLKYIRVVPQKHIFLDLLLIVWQTQRYLAD